MPLKWWSIVIPKQITRLCGIISKWTCLYHMIDDKNAILHYNTLVVELCCMPVVKRRKMFVIKRCFENIMDKIVCCIRIRSDIRICIDFGWNIEAFCIRAFVRLMNSTHLKDVLTNFFLNVESTSLRIYG